MVDGLFSLTMGRGVGQGGADVSQLQDCGSVACGGGRVPGQGWSRGWAGWRSLGTVNVNVLCDLSLLQTLEFKARMGACP